MLSGDNSILQKATTAKEQTEIGHEKEIVALAYNSALAKKVSSNDLTPVIASDLNPELTKQGAYANGDSPITVTFTNSKRQYTINNGIVDYAGIKSDDDTDTLNIADAVIGTPILNYTASDISDWKVFYSEGNDLYITTTNKPEELEYQDAFGSLGKEGLSVYSGTDDFTEENVFGTNTKPAKYPAVASGLLSKIYNPNTKQLAIQLSNDCMKTVNYMLDSTQWGSYVNSSKGANWAIAGPTIELFVKTYNKLTNSNFAMPELGEYGYDYEYELSGFFDTGDSNPILSECEYWIASPAYIWYYDASSHPGYWSVSSRFGLGADTYAYARIWFSSNSTFDRSSIRRSI